MKTMLAPKNQDEYDEYSLACIRDGTTAQAASTMSLKERGTYVDTFAKNWIMNSCFLFIEWARDPELNNGRGYVQGDIVEGDYPYGLYLSWKKWPHLEEMFFQSLANKYIH